MVREQQRIVILVRHDDVAETPLCLFKEILRINEYGDARLQRSAEWMTATSTERRPYRHLMTSARRRSKARRFVGFLGFLRDRAAPHLPRSRCGTIVVAPMSLRAETGPSDPVLGWRY